MMATLKMETTVQILWNYLLMKFYGGLWIIVAVNWSVLALWFKIWVGYDGIITLIPGPFDTDFQQTKKNSFWYNF